MTIPRRRLFLLALAVTASFWTTPFRAHEHNACVEVNNSSNNRLGVFELLGATGQLKWVEEVTTGGVGSNGGYISIPQIASTAPADGRACVFAVNSATHDVTAFQVTMEQEPGAPCPCHNRAAGGPVSIGPGASFGPLGGGVAVTPDGLALYTANPGSSDITSFAVGPRCAINRAGLRVPAPPRPADIQVKPDGRCLAVSSPVSNRVAMYRIDTAHRLIPVRQFDVPGPGRAAGVEFSSRLGRDVLYVSKAVAEETVIVRFDVEGASCRLGAEPAVTRLPSGRTSSVARLDPDNRCLFTANHPSSLLAVNHPPSTISAFAVDSDTGDLTHVTTVDDAAFYPAGMAFGHTFDGTRHLYYTGFTREIFRRPVRGCVPGAVIGPGVRASLESSLPSTGPLRTLTIIE